MQSQETRRFTGYRIQFAEPRVQPILWQNLVESLRPYAPLVEAFLQEKYFVDDTMRGAPLDVLMAPLGKGELFIKVVDGAVVAMALIRDIVHDREGVFEGWGHPALRGNYQGARIEFDFAAEVHEYAFKPFSNGNIATDGLGLLKLKAEIAINNYPAIKALKAMSKAGYDWHPLCRIPFGAFFRGEAHDTVLLESYNPALQAVQTQGLMPSHEKRRRIGDPINSDAAIRESAGLHDAADRSTGRAEPQGDYPAGQLRRRPGRNYDNQEKRQGENGLLGPSAGLSAVNEPVRPGADRPGGPGLLRPDDSASPGSAESGFLEEGYEQF